MGRDESQEKLEKARAGRVEQAVLEWEGRERKTFWSAAIWLCTGLAQEIQKEGCDGEDEKEGFNAETAESAEKKND